MKSDPLASRVYEYISQKIESGEYTSNQRITEVEICNELGVSRTPAREALMKLAGENLLEKIPNRGFIVREINEKEKLDTFAVIGALDALAGILALEYLTEEDIQKMSESCEMMEIAIKYKNYKGYLKISNDFHNIYRIKCDNQVLLNTIDSCIYNFIPKSYLSDDEEDLFKMLEHSNREHFRLVEAFRTKDEDLINRIIKMHWTTIPIHEML